MPVRIASHKVAIIYRAAVTYEKKQCPPAKILPIASDAKAAIEAYIRFSDPKKCRKVPLLPMPSNSCSHYWFTGDKNYYFGQRQGNLCFFAHASYIPHNVPTILQHWARKLTIHLPPEIIQVYLALILEQIA